MAMCKKHNCFSILGVQKMTQPTVADAHDIEKIFRDFGMSTTYRIAWVDEGGSEIREMLEYTLAVLRNRKLLNGGAFENTAAAKKWLLEKKLGTAVATAASPIGSTLTAGNWHFDSSTF